MQSFHDKFSSLNCHEAISKSIEKCDHNNGENCPECNLMIDISLTALSFRRTWGRGVFSPQVNDWLDKIDNEFAVQRMPPTPKFEE